MSEADALKDEIKKLNARATAKKMDLHDLSEELPVNWERILDVARETYDAYKELTEKRAALKALGA
ncbi:CCE_0567 family metalloprotein [Azospirillum sp.]|uniref:CCE_0567 family metalloprotein n=1 Tax=Azospirillum sp. TaxID=34012 RepID=UPI002D6049DC|nr:CCE_0567 family metalloprotein [Azospirillum sp.]HYF90424.1 CCE_0567 family metalloprotein [Azospirillum sp.]